MIGSVLIFLLYYLVLVASNPINQLVQPCPVCQNPYSPSLVQPSNTNPYTQPATVQNPTHDAAAFQDTLNQLLFTKILTNPSLQKILDPNTRLYNQNGVEITRQAANTNSPNVINNYFIVPPEFFNLNETSTKNGVKVKNAKANAKKKAPNAQEAEIDSLEGKTKRKRRKRLRTANVERVSEINDDVAPKIERVRKKKKRKPNANKARSGKIIAMPLIEEPVQDLVKKENLEEKETKNVKRNKNKRQRPNKNTVKEELIVEIPESAEILEIGVKNHELRTEKPKTKRPKARKKSNEANNCDVAEIDAKADGVLKNIEAPEHCPERSKDPTEKRKTRNPKAEKAKEQIPDNVPQMGPIPDDIMKSFLPFMNFYYPNGNYPLNFEQMYQNMPNFNNFRKNRRRKKIKNEANTIEITLKPKKSKNSTSETPTEAVEVQKETAPEQTEDVKAPVEEIHDIPMEIPKKEQPIESPVEIIELIEVPVKKENYVALAEDQNEDLTELEAPELGTEDFVPIMYSNRIIKDYYPVFYDESISYEDFGNRREEAEKFYYKTGSSEELSRDRTYENDKHEHIFSEDAEVFKPIQGEEIGRLRTDTDKESEFVEPTNNKDKSTKNTKTEKTNEELEYKIPPSLEIPDFKTKKLEKRTDESEFDKSSIYSDVKTPQYNQRIKPSSEIKRVVIPAKNTRPQSDDVETVFAKSKVRKYGMVSEETVEDTSASTISSEEDSSYRDGSTTYIVARSLGHADDYY